MASDVIAHRSSLLPSTLRSTQPIALDDHLTNTKSNQKLLNLHVHFQLPFFEKNDTLATLLLAL